MNPITDQVVRRSLITFWAVWQFLFVLFVV